MSLSEDEDFDEDGGALAQCEHRYAERSDRLRTQGRFVRVFTAKDDVTDDALLPELSAAMAASRVDYRGREG